jgi:hypothetical protein
LFRDKTPLVNLGYGVTSRDIPATSNEEKNPNPNSGFIARALDDKPIVKYISTTVATLAATYAASRTFSKGGIKLAKTIQKSADSGSQVGRTFVQNAAQIRKALDNLEGINRYVEGFTDPYSRLIYQSADGKVIKPQLTRLAGPDFVSDGTMWMTRKEFKSIRAGRQPVAEWGYRDELQTRLARGARSLPLMLPSTYLVQRGLTDPIFGNSEDREKVKWYNPVDVITDFVKQSTLNITSILLPEAVAGASIKRLRQLADAPYQDFPLPLSREQLKTANKIADIKTILMSFGQDSSKIIQEASRISNSASYAFNTSFAEAQRKEGGVVFSLNQARRGAAAARAASERSGEGKLARTAKIARSYLFGYANKSDDILMVPGYGEFGAKEKTQGFIDTIPTLKGFTTGAREFRQQFKTSRRAYDVISGALSYDEALRRSGGDITEAADTLTRTIQSIKKQHTSRFSNLVYSSLNARSIVDSDGEVTKVGQFTREFENNAYLRTLQQSLVRRGIDKDVAADFVGGIQVNQLLTQFDKTRNISERITFGIKKINVSTNDEFFEAISERAKKDLGKKAKNLSPEILRASFRQADAPFTSELYRNTLRAQATSAFKDVEKNIIVPHANLISRPQKALYEDFTGAITPQKMSFLSRKAAQKLGIKLIESDGAYTSDRYIATELAKRGLDASDASQLKGFLVDNKLMTPASNMGGFNIFGLKEISIDKAFDRGIFESFDDKSRAEARRLYGQVALQDPVSKTIGYSALTGVYETASGRIVDTTRIRSGAKSFLNSLTEGYGIPIVKFNPLQLFGFGGPKGVNPDTEIQFLRGTARQDFVAGKANRPDVYAWVNQRSGIFGNVGKLFGVTSTTTGADVDELSGLYKRFSSIETDLYSRAARLASGREQETDSALTGGTRSRLEKIKALFDVDEEQPSSLFRKAGRFVGRKKDIQNPVVFARLLDEKTINIGRGKTLSLVEVDGSPAVVNELGETVFDSDEVTRAFDAFREQQTSRRGTPLPIISEYTEKLELPRLNIKGIDTPLSEIADDELLDAVASLENIYGITASEIRSEGKDPIGLTRAMKFVTNLSEEVESLSTDLIKHRSPTISTRQDYLRNAINKVLIEITAYDKYGGDPGKIASKIEEALQVLKRTGRISSDQLAEARAAALENIFDLFSYQTYNPAAQFGKNQQAALSSIIKKREQSPEFAKALSGLSKPFSTQTISNVGATGSGRLTALVRPFFKKNFGVAPYELADNAVNPLGNARTTFVPTFGSQLDRAARGETTFGRVLANTVGLTSYSSPDTFSAASIPSIHLSDRINRYFGTVGLSVDADKYSSPLSFFAGGIVGKRVAPLYVGGALALGADRTIGGLTQERDDRGERVYSPFFLSKAARGAVEVQSLASGLTPGGMGYEEKKEQLLEGEVPVRQGRYWPLGVTPFAGGKVQYYRPSYYRRMQSGSTYTSDAFGSPIERLAYGYDFSPLRPFDPYRFEREHYFDRPYPVTGEYFTGPFGAITPALNMTIGRLLKPAVQMHQQEVSQALSQYVPAGYGGAFDPSGLLSSGRVSPTYEARIGGGGGAAFGAGRPSGPITGLQIGNYNSSIAGAAGQLNTARNISYSAIATANQGYTQSGQYGPPPVPGYIPPSIAPAGAPISVSSTAFQKTELGYRMQEMAGIYGFGFSSFRESFGFGSGDLQPNVAVLQSAAKAYGSTRSFWDLNLGGLGDVPASESTLELSEITRRFIPKERTDITYLNPIKNTMGMKYPFLPGSDYFINFQTGDPFSKIQEGELRLPGVAYERLNPLTKNYDSPVTQLNILADVAPYSRQFRSLDRTLNMGNLEPSERVQVQNIRAQVEQTTKRNEFSPYKYKYASAEELGISSSAKAIGQMGEYLAHRDTFINTKFFPNRTAQEDWERRNVYGNSFPEWNSPIESFIKPIYNKSTQRNPLSAGLITAGIGALFGRGPKERAIGSLIGLTTGMAFSAFHNVKEAFTGERFIPKERKKQMALEEYTDIISYVKNKSLATQAAQAGDMASANQFTQAAKRTMYGADLYGSSVDTLSLAVPKRKREHFREMINAPVEERERILSTAPRLERRIYQAAWGMPVEEKPDLTEFFSRHELPDLSWEGWHPNTNIDHIKIKMGQSMGINMSQMGYYPQQIREANLTNPSYPSFSAQESQSAVAARLRMLMSRNGISGSVMPVQNNSGQSSINISAGIF